MKIDRSTSIALLFSLALPAAGIGASSHPRRKSSHRSAAKAPTAFAAESANDRAVERLLEKGASGPAVLRAQVLLDRAHFSPGEIDASMGESTLRAAAAFDAANGIDPTMPISAETWKILDRDSRPVVVRYAIAPADVAGPFVAIPEDMMEKAALPAMGYSSPLEALGEKFHANPELLKKMNPGKAFDVAGTEILALDVSRPPLAKAASIAVTESDRSLTVMDGAGKIAARFPATVGSEHDPLPMGEWKVTGIGKNPTFKYNPDLFWDADAKDTKATIPAGPNNPVGVVWIDLSKPHYGIHGSPEPSTIGKTESHGCIRLTNWDASDLAQAVGAGTPAILKP